MSYYLGATELTVVLPAGVSIGTNTSPLTLDEVGSMIFEVESEIDGFAAAAGYAVPIATGATYGFAAMKQAIKQGAAAAVLNVLFPTMGGPGDKTSSAATYRQAYQDFKKALAAGTLTLVGAAAAGDGAGGRVLPFAGQIASPLIDTCTVF